MAAGGGAGFAILPLAFAALMVFLLRQPATITVKALSGRRDRKDLRPALIWCAIYLSLALAGVALLITGGHGRIVLLAIPGLITFSWHLWLVRRREERRQPGIEIIAAGSLALTAPAAYWIAGGESNLTAWTLWLLTWLQSAASIVHIYVRLAQRELDPPPPTFDRLRLGWRSLLYAGFNMLLSLALVALSRVPAMVPVAYSVPMLDSLEGVLRPAVGVPPRRIGVRQLLISSAFVAVIIIAYLA